MPQTNRSSKAASSRRTKLATSTIPITTLQWAILATLRGNPYSDQYSDRYNGGQTYNYRLVGPERAAGDRMVTRGLLRRTKDGYAPTPLGHRSFEAAMKQPLPA